MKVYQANDELANILFDHGFIETSKESDKIRGKKCFKLSKSSNKSILFDHINIRINQDRFKEISENDLKLVLLFFKLNAADRKELTSTGSFSLKKMNNKLSAIIKELEGLKEFALHQSRQTKLNRIIGIYNSINF